MENSKKNYIAPWMLYTVLRPDVSIAKMVISDNIAELGDYDEGEDFEDLFS